MSDQRNFNVLQCSLELTYREESIYDASCGLEMDRMFFDAIANYLCVGPEVIE